MSATFPYLWRCAGVSGGYPCLRTTGILVEFVAGRFAAGESIAALADAYGVPPVAVEDAIRLIVVAKRPSLESQRATAIVARVLPETRRPR